MTTRFIPAALFLLLACISCDNNEPVKHTRHHAPPATPPAPTGIAVDSAKLSLFAPLPDNAKSSNNLATDEKISLGQRLFYDERLSKTQTESCNSCHDVTKWGADDKDFSVGASGKKLSRNTPTLLNAALESSQYWAGRYETIEEATRAMLLDAEVTGETEARILDTLKSIPQYVDAFKKAYPDAADPVTIDGAVKAIAVFERTLLTPAPWDKFLKGDQSALSDDEKKGFLKFVDVGCPTCHTGPLVGATMFQKLGKEKPWPDQTDKGRSLVTKSPSDEMMFKVSALRNVEHTAPYFHDALGKTLEEAVKMMGEYQLKKDLSADDVKSIVTWLKSLDGTVPASAQKKPEAFPSTPKTPKPAKK